ncbi:Meiosis specific protein SPO22 [Penicillium bovifimosum]|uniref:Meiosis specific protein SPO22 n=1 Tax=Penicillium bovifimosum TaxID=126998 RepID=A0A9W9KX16_9EURO|nr:Meiosis specific protein SPO22 [Penicillium bovifimosum]KAJ5123881.1 Meiosis specific protein SPO22 [Penicillium bovifimosum]
MDPVRSPAASLEELGLLLQRVLNTDSSPTAPILTPDALLELNNSLNTNPFNPVDTGLAASRLDRQATNLWNRCTVMTASHGSNPENLRMLAKVRAFAFALLNSSQAPDLLGLIRAVELGFVATRLCIVNGESELAVNIITAVGDKLNRIQDSHPEVDPSVNRGLLTAFYLLHVRLAWLQGLLDAVDIFWANVPEPTTVRHRQMAFESCFIMGDQALAQQYHELAVTWLQRALHHLQELDVDHGSAFPFFNEWDLVIRHSLVVACTKLQTPGPATTRMTQMIILKERYPEHPSVVLLELSSKDETTSVEDLLKGLQGFVENNRLTDLNMPVIYQFARGLGYRGGLEDGMEALRILLARPMPSHDWTEKCFLAFALLTSRRPDTGLDGMGGLWFLIDDLDKRGFSDFSTGAAHAIVACVWKLIGAAIQKHEFWEAREWLSICASPKIRHACSTDFIIAIQKKLITCHMLDGSLADARELLARGLVQDQLDLQRMYLEFKLTMMEGKNTNNFFVLGFSEQPDSQKQLAVLSCAMEAYRLRKSSALLTCLEQFQKFMTRKEIYHEDFTAAEHYTFVITLLLKELSHGFSYRLGELIKNVTHLALNYARENSGIEGGPTTVSITQVQWLYRTTYEIARKLLKSPGLEWATTILQYSRKFADLYRSIAYPGSEAGVPRPHFFAVAYLDLLAEAAEARGEVDPGRKGDHTDKNQKINWEKVRVVFRELNDLSGWSDGEEEAKVDTEAKEARQLTNARFFDLEAAMHLGRWEDVAQICESNDTFPMSWFYPPLVDLTLKLDLPPALAIKILKHVVRNREDSLCEAPATAIAERVNFHTSLPRYLHCIFMLAISPDPAPAPVAADGFPDVNMVDAKTAEEVIDRVLSIVEQGTGINSEEESQLDSGDNLRVNVPDSGLYPFQGNYPTPELTKMATLTFNRATDYYRVVQDEVCKRWANKAIRLAHQVPGPEGQWLAGTLQAKLDNLMLL